MGLWQEILLAWGIIAALDRHREILGAFSRDTTFPWHERILFAIIWWAHGLPWLYPRLFLPTANWLLAHVPALKRWNRARLAKQLAFILD